MAVFTSVTPDEAAAFIAPLQIGKLNALRGIASGIENTNYFLTTDGGEFVLTLFELLREEELPFYLQLMRHMALKKIPVPEPKADAGGRLVFPLKGKPASVVTRLGGQQCLAPEARHCAQVGAMLARMHDAGTDFALQQDNPRGFKWWLHAAERVLPLLDAERRDVLQDELRFQEALTEDDAYQALPRGPVHADLFRDNVLFSSKGLLSGFFDFYFAGTDVLMFDVAVCLNDWCINHQTGARVPSMTAAFMDAYARERPLSNAERRYLPSILRAAALRFWLSRLGDKHFPRESTLLHAHDPEHFYRVLSHHRQVITH